MPVRTGRITQDVKPHPTFPKRYQVFLDEDQWTIKSGPRTILFTLEPESRNWIAAFCQAAKDRDRAVMVWTMSTQYGERIVKVDWAPEQTGEAA